MVQSPRFYIYPGDFAAGPFRHFIATILEIPENDISWNLVHGHDTAVSAFHDGATVSLFAIGRCLPGRRICPVGMGPSIQLERFHIQGKARNLGGSLDLERPANVFAGSNSPRYGRWQPVVC